MRAFVIRAEWDPKPGYKLSDWEKQRGISLRGDLTWKNPTWGVEKDYPEPEPGPGELKIKVHACGVCGSDVHMLMKNPDGYTFFAGECGFPVVPGHEFSGEVVEVGKEVTKFKVGDLVTVEECQWCGECYACVRGWFNQCQRLDQLGFDTGNDGAMAEYVIADEKYCYSINSLYEAYSTKQEVLDAGTFVEPTSVAYEGLYRVTRGGFQPGGDTVVYGSGPIGLAAIQLLKTTGAGKIILFEPNEFRRSLGAKMGATHTFNPDEVDPPEVVMDLTNGEGSLLTAECAGVPEITSQWMQEHMAIGGKITQIGMGPGGANLLPIKFQQRAGMYVGSLGHSGNGDFPSVINLMANKRIDMLPAITARFPLEQAAEGIPAANNGQNAKVLIVP